jgi:hypothetical protein
VSDAPDRIHKRFGPKKIRIRWRIRDEKGITARVQPKFSATSCGGTLAQPASLNSLRPSTPVVFGGVAAAAGSAGVSGRGGRGGSVSGVILVMLINDAQFCNQIHRLSLVNTSDISVRKPGLTRLLIVCRCGRCQISR